MASSEQQQVTGCYRHPRNETAVRCSACERPICPDCMVFSAVGIKCPECAGTPSAPRRKARRISTAAGSGTSTNITKVIIGIVIAAFVLQISQAGGSLEGTSGEIFTRGYLLGPKIADGEWWRLVTSAFLHVGPIHIAFNMLMLWWFGRSLEVFLGPSRFLGVYVVSLLAGAAGALLINPTSPTVGASGAVFGILGAGLVLERRGTYVFGGAAVFIVGFNIVFTFLVANISIGGHVGGLIGGVLSMLLLTRLGRVRIGYGPPGLAPFAGLLLLAVVSVAVAFARVQGLA